VAQTSGADRSKTAKLEFGAPGDGAPSKPPGDELGWHNRGYVPHFDSTRVLQHVTFRLADSLPKAVLGRLEDELKLVAADKRDSARREKLDTWIDAGHGACILRDAAIAEIVQNSLLCFDAERYRLLTWVVMPNHVHALIEPLSGWTVAKIVASWKRFTARKINACRSECGRNGRRVWAR